METLPYVDYNQVLNNNLMPGMFHSAILNIKPLNLNSMDLYMDALTCDLHICCW